MNRCAFGTKDPDYIAYHNRVWGKPMYDSQALFELLALESQHAGLSWLTILKKKEAYQQAFYQFDPYKIAKMTESDVDALMTFPNIIHHRKNWKPSSRKQKDLSKLNNNMGLSVILYGLMLIIHLLISSIRIQMNG